MKRVLISTIVLMLLSFTCVADAAVAWEDHFDPIKPTWTQTTAVWTDLAGSTAQLTENDPAQTYGFAQSEVITVDVSRYNELVVVASAIDANSAYTIQIQEVGGAGAFADAVSRNNYSGTQIVNIAKLMGWSGTKSFVINIWIEGNNLSSTFDLVQIRESLAGQDAWLENFNPIKTTWAEPTCYWTDTPGPNAVLTENGLRPTQWYGVANSEVLTLDVNDYHKLYVKTSAVDSGCVYSIQIHEVGPNNPQYRDVISNIGYPSEHTVDIAAIMGWSGRKTFRINVWLICSPGHGGLTATFDTIKLSSGEVEQPKPAFWEDHFDPVKPSWFSMGAIWDDVPGTTAVLTEDNPGFSYGKVESETLTVDVNTYPELSAVVTDIDEDAWLDIGIQQEGGTWTYTDVISDIEEPNTYKVDIADVMNWQGYQSFRIVLWINGNGKTVTLDKIQLGMHCGTDVLQGDYNDDCAVNFQDLASIGESWMNQYNRIDLKRIADNWLEKEY